LGSNAAAIKVNDGIVVGNGMRAHGRCLRNLGGIVNDI